MTRSTSKPRNQRRKKPVRATPILPVLPPIYWEPRDIATLIPVIKEKFSKMTGVPMNCIGIKLRIVSDPKMLQNSDPWL